MSSDTPLTDTQRKLIAEIEREPCGPCSGNILAEMANPDRDSRWWDGMLLTAQEQWDGLSLDARLLACLWGAVRADGPSRGDFDC